MIALSYKDHTAMTKKEKRNRKLQELCREYLYKLRYMAKKHGLLDFVDTTIELNKQEKCKGTEYEVNLLARMVDEERLHRDEVPKLLGKSYRQCFEDEDFEKVKTLKTVGKYSKVSTLLLAAMQENKKKNGK